MRTLVVVATTHLEGVNRFHMSSLLEAKNLRDFLEQTGEYERVAIYDLDGSQGPIQRWAELLEGSR